MRWHEVEVDVMDFVVGFIIFLFLGSFVGLGWFLRWLIVEVLR